MSHLVDQYKRLIEHFTDGLLDVYSRRLRDRPPPKRLKEINDTVWQTVSLQPFEVLILDSPLLQRLRRISQLGVAKWVYPSGGHTRLEHSIGALNQVQRMIDSLQRQEKQGSDGLLPDELVNVLRLAALCHDIGHGFMSHVSENALNANGATGALMIDLQDALDKERLQLSEAAAYYMLGSRAFCDLLEVAMKLCREHLLPEQPHKLLQNAVIGKLIHTRYPLIHELISGPFDADKLDYLPRDARMAGVPVVTDIPRLVQKIRLVEISQEQLPKEIKEQLSEKYPSYYIQAVAISGARTLDELTLGKTLLFDKIYRHQKVRAAEAMVAKIVDLLIDLAPDRKSILPLLLDDSELLSFERSVIARQIGPLPDDAWTKLEPARELCKRLRERRIFVRAYAFASTMPNDPFRHELVQRQGIERLEREVRQPEKRSELLDQIVRELTRMFKTGVVSDAVRSEDLRYYVALDPPPAPSGTSEISRAYLVAEKNLLSKFRDDFPESSPWSNAYLMTRDLGFVFSAEEIAVPVFLATEAVLRRRYNVRTPDSAVTYSKVNRTELGRVRLELTRSGYYDDLPRDVRAIPERLTKLDVKEIVDDVVLRLGPFDGAPLGVAGSGTTSIRVTAERVQAWLRQFRNDEEIEGALDLLRRLRLVARAEISRTVRHFLVAHPQFTGASVCPFGAPKDSSSILTYYVQDLAEEFALHVETLEEALLYSDRPILFVDDLIGTGRQAQDVILGWFGEPTELGEDHGHALSESARNGLAKRLLGFLFSTGDPDGAVALRSTCVERNLNATVEIGDGGSPPRLSASPLFEQRAREIGFQLLEKYSGKERTDRWRQERSLGYGNQGYLVVFPYNTPTQSVTLLWCSGRVDGEDWLPLVPRRRKT